MKNFKKIEIKKEINQKKFKKFIYDINKDQRICINFFINFIFFVNKYYKCVSSSFTSMLMNSARNHFLLFKRNALKKSDKILIQI